MAIMSKGNALKATSHMSQEPWPWKFESPKESVPIPSQDNLHNHVVWSRTLECSVKSYSDRFLNQMLF